MSWVASACQKIFKTFSNFFFLKFFSKLFCFEKLFSNFLTFLYKLWRSVSLVRGLKQRDPLCFQPARREGPSSLRSDPGLFVVKNKTWFAPTSSGLEQRDNPFCFASGVASEPTTSVCEGGVSALEIRIYFDLF